ncbi:1-phosphofructokinase family hexose kinase [Schaalia sp. Marseille-Q2122]|uniref:1-phosphofructokinase family hexose kinase n=1 Tax=Schaalia sp. Marseille-Q2122 TaxID=2736604 RepID=UPI00158A09F7|nr:hexose kinase [Schaalia sp. Marseille-Q2122]
MRTIWTITPNPALDFTYKVPALNYGHSHRVDDVEIRPGGKGINVARVLAQLGYTSSITGFLGGSNGTFFRELLSQCTPADLVRPCFIDTTAQTRMSIAVVDSDATVFNEAGSAPQEEDWGRLCTLLATEVRPGDIVACCGSFPGDSSATWMSAVVRTVHEAGARILVDASGALLRAACEAGADVVKPNDIELRQTTGVEDVAEGARALLTQGVGVVIVSEGARGMSVHGPDGAFRALPARSIEGNPTGAGDASVAAWCAFLASYDGPLSAQALAGALPQAVALSGAAVACPVAGEVDRDLYEEMLPLVKVESY